MPLFTSDLSRRIALGFVLGAALVAVANAGHVSDQIAPPAQAAEPSEAGPFVAPEFLIQPVD